MRCETTRFAVAETSHGARVQVIMPVYGKSMTMVGARTEFRRLWPGLMNDSSRRPPAKFFSEMRFISGLSLFTKRLDRWHQKATN